MLKIFLVVLGCGAILVLGLLVLCFAGAAERLGYERRRLIIILSFLDEHGEQKEARLYAAMSKHPDLRMTHFAFSNFIHSVHRDGFIAKQVTHEGSPHGFVEVNVYSLTDPGRKLLHEILPVERVAA